MNYAGFDFNQATELVHTLPHTNAVDTLSILVVSGTVALAVSWGGQYHAIGTFVVGDNRIIRGMFGIRSIRLTPTGGVAAGHVAGSYSQ